MKNILKTFAILGLLTIPSAQLFCMEHLAPLQESANKQNRFFVKRICYVFT